MFTVYLFNWNVLYSLYFPSIHLFSKSIHIIHSSSSHSFISFIWSWTHSKGPLSLPSSCLGRMNTASLHTIRLSFSGDVIWGTCQQQLPLEQLRNSVWGSGAEGEVLCDRTSGHSGNNGTKWFFLSQCSAWKCVWSSFLFVIHGEGMRHAGNAGDKDRHQSIIYWPG